MIKENKFDYIVVGSGTSGSTIAARLIEKSPNSVLLIEAGVKPKGIWFKVPLGIGKILHNNKYVWKFFTKKISFLNKRKIYIPQGKVLGGSSTVNGLVFTRGVSEKFNEMSKMGCDGWSYDEVIPYFKKLENYSKGDSLYRGKGGPINISDVSPRDRLSEAFRLSCIESGYKENKDYNSYDSEGVSYLQLNTKKGRRVNVFNSYMNLLPKKNNLHIQTNSIVKKILFEGKKAIGVEFIYKKKIYKAFAKKEIILSCGAIQSPKLLELSGIGNSKILNDLSIPIIHELIGVGENLRDHYNVRLSFRSKNIKTLNNALNNNLNGFKLVLRYLLYKDGLLATPSATIQALIKSDIKKSYPDIKLQLVHLTEKTRFGIANDSKTDNFSGFSISCYQLFPKSYGTTHINSDNIFDDPVINPNYLSDNNDRKIILNAIKIAREITSQEAFKNYIIDEIRPGKNIIGDNDLMKFIFQTGHTTYHPIGTCKMGNDKYSVVDNTLRVKGVENLRVADASILPFQVASNTNAQCIMIGEKAADLILEEYPKL